MCRDKHLWLWLLLSPACTDVDLAVVVDDQLFVTPRQEARVTVCAPEPLEDPAPYKILFVIDTSYSNSWTDPAPTDGEPRRERAVRQVITDYIEAPNVLFGVVTFSDVPKRQTFGFTRDLEILNSAVGNVGAAQGGTNYSDSLWVITDFILADIAAIGPEAARRTHYLVFWVSDGFPTIGVVDSEALLPGVLYLKGAVHGRVAEFRFNTAFLAGNDPSVPAAETARARTLLQEMATAGGGTFTDVGAAEEIHFDISLVPIIRRFALATVVANNRHARFNAAHPLVDSDGDGLTDGAELALGLDPTAADTDGDGFSDGIEHALAIAGTTVPAGYAIVEPNPLGFNDGCAEAGRDTDGEGLSDCDELLLGSERERADTDGDLIIDSIEHALGTSPLVDDPDDDFDLDGVADELEVRGHLAPREHNEADEVSRWSYRYIVTPVNEDDPTQPSCYRVEVNNLWSSETLATPTHARGVNEVELLAAFRPVDGGEPTVFRRAVVEVRILLAEDIQMPASGLLGVEPGDFATLPILR